MLCCLLLGNQWQCVARKLDLRLDVCMCGGQTLTVLLGLFATTLDRVSSGLGHVSRDFLWTLESSDEATRPRFLVANSAWQHLIEIPFRAVSTGLGLEERALGVSLN